MSIKNRINEINEFFKGMEITNNTIIVKVAYPSKWGVYPNEEKGILVTKSDNNDHEWFYYGDVFSVNLDDIFDLINDTIKINNDAQKKVDLLYSKYDELKELFSKEPYERLVTLEFSLKNVVEEKKKRKYTRRKNKVNVVEDKEENALKENKQDALDETFEDVVTEENNAISKNV